jgi:hypothetical protein
MKTRPFDHGPPSAKRSRTMQDSVAASVVGWNATQSHVVSAEWRVLQPGAGGNVGAVVRFTMDLLLQQATFPPGGGDTTELANTLKAAVENLGGVEPMRLQSTHLRTRPALRTPKGHRHAKRVLLQAEERSQARTRLAQEAVRDATYTEHWGDKQLRDLHADLPEVLDHLIEERGMEAMVDPARTSVRFNIFVAPTQCEVGLLVRYHVPVAQGSTRSITFCADVKAMDVDAQTVTLVSDKYDGWVRIWVEEHEDVPVSCLNAMGIWRNEVVLTAAGACAKTTCVTRLSRIVCLPSLWWGALPRARPPYLPLAPLPPFWAQTPYRVWHASGCPLAPPFDTSALPDHQKMNTCSLSALHGESCGCGICSLRCRCSARPGLPWAI